MDLGIPGPCASADCSARVSVGGAGSSMDHVVLGSMHLFAFRSSLNDDVEMLQVL